MPKPSNSLHTLILAAGSSSRLGTPKQLIQQGGHSLIEQIIMKALAISQHTHLVVGANSKRIIPTIRHYPIDIIHCHHWNLGMGRSLKTGIESLKDDCTGVLILLTDQIKITGSHLENLKKQWLAQPKCAIATSIKGLNSVPAIIPRSAFKTIDYAGDTGARTYLRDPKNSIIGLDFPPAEVDVDQFDDLKFMDP